ncbi:Uncharacterised protein [uncultured archaeon]|nr:Uncharacterised protein [uncultured archaeon]
MKMKNIAMGIVMGAVSLFMGSKIQAQDSLSAKGQEKIATYPNLSFKGVFPMATWFPYTGDWQWAALTLNNSKATASVQLNQGLASGVCANLEYDQPIGNEKGTGTLMLAKTLFHGKAALGGMIGSDAAPENGKISFQANPIHNGKMLLAAGVQLGANDAKYAIELRKASGSKVVGLFANAVFAEGKMNGCGAGAGIAFKKGKGLRLNAGVGMAGGRLQDVRLGAQLPTKRFGTPDIRISYCPKNKMGAVTLGWTLPQK